jgi:seryl-tRNA(Sec) selenium transferase
MQNIPIYAMLTASLAELKSKGEQIQAALAEYSEQVEITVQNTVAQMGGGSLPGQEIPSIGLAINFPRLRLRKQRRPSVPGWRCLS